MESALFDLVIVGAGPGGLSAAAHAGEAGLTHVLLEAGAAHANTIQQYQHFKHVMAEPSVLPLRSDMQFAAGRREAILESWEEGIRAKNVNIKYRAEVSFDPRHARQFRYFHQVRRSHSRQECDSCARRAGSSTSCQRAGRRSALRAIHAGISGGAARRDYRRNRRRRCGD